MKRRKKLLLVGLATLIPTTCLVAVGYYYIVEPIAAGARLNEVAKKYQEAGLPWVADDLRPNPPVTPEQNAAPLLQSAIQTHNGEHLQPKVAAIRDALKANDLPKADRLLQEHEKTLDLAIQASKKPKLDFNRDWDLGPDLQFPESAHIKAYAELLAARAQVKDSQDNLQAALADLEAALRLGPLLAQEPNLIALLVSIRCQTTAREAAITIATKRDSQNKPVDDLITLLENNPDQADFRHAISSEPYLYITILRNLNSRKGYKDLEQGHYNLLPRDQRVSDGYPKSDLSRAFLTRSLEYWTRMHMLFDKYENDFSAASQELQNRGYYDSKSFTWASEKLDHFLMPDFAQAAVAVINLKAHHRVHLAYLDALRHRQKTGTFPTTITDLNPAYTDPHTNQPLKTALVNGQFRVYSVGPDKSDDQGQTKAELSQESQSQNQKGTGDIVAPNPD